MSKQWFAYDREEGFAAHVSEQAAREDAEGRAKSWNDEAEHDREQYLDDALTVCWGKIHGQATEAEHPVDYHIPHFAVREVPDAV